MRQLLLALFCAALFACASSAQSLAPELTSTPKPVSLCDLTQNPKAYDGKWIIVHASVSMSFEDFSLYDPACHDHHTSVWLTFGGDQGEVTTYCCVNPRRKKGTDLEVNGQRVPLVRDDSLREFLRFVETQRLRRPDQHECAGDECFLYRPISTSITGLFLSGNDGWPGYGHLGCCHLLVISRVSDVSAERTLVPAGGRFACHKETWKANPEESARIRDLLECSHSEQQDCDRNSDAAFNRIAAHWNDHIDATHGHGDQSGGDVQNSIGSWISSNLLTSYRVIEGKSSGLPNVLVLRQACVPVSGFAPKPLSEKLSRDRYAVSWEDDEPSAKIVGELMEKSQFNEASAKMAEASKSILAEGDQSWRSRSAKNAALHALRLQAQKWGFTPALNLRSDRCDDPSLSEQDHILFGCGWYSDDAMQELWVSMQKPKSAPTGAPWVVTSVSATVCH